MPSRLLPCYCRQRDNKDAAAAVEDGKEAMQGKSKTDGKGKSEAENMKKIKGRIRARGHLMEERARTRQQKTELQMLRFTHSNTWRTRERLRAAKSRNRNRRYNNYMLNLERRRVTKKILFQMELQALDAAVLYGIANIHDDIYADALDAIATIWDDCLSLHLRPAPPEHEREAQP